MTRMHEIDREGANLAAGVKAGFAVVFVGMIVALGLGVAPLGVHDEHVAATPPATEAGADHTTYFPSQYPLNATEPEEHVQAF